MKDDEMTIQKIEADAPEARSADLVAENVAKLKALFPELLTETANRAAILEQHGIKNVQSL